MVNHLTEETRPVWSRLTFEQARENFEAGAHGGMFSRMHWPTLSTIDVASLVRDYLLAEARAGLERLGADEEVIDYYLGIIRGAREEPAKRGALAGAHPRCALPKRGGAGIARTSISPGQDARVLPSQPGNGQASAHVADRWRRLVTAGTSVPQDASPPVTCRPPAAGRMGTTR